jgi:acyl-CoA hydrolase
VGNLVTLTAELTYVGRTSMEVRVSVVAENPLTGETVHTNVAYVVYVAINAEGRPQPVAPMRVETPEEQIHFEQAQERQAERKLQHQREQALRELKKQGT